MIWTMPELIGGMVIRFGLKAVLWEAAVMGNMIMTLLPANPHTGKISFDFTRKNLPHFLRQVLFMYLQKGVGSNTS